MAKNRKILLSLVALALLAAATVLPITLANAAPQKIYDLAVTPASLSAGATNQTLTATFKNATPSGNSTINSIKLFAAAPAGFTITEATGSGNEVIQPGGQSVWVSNVPGVRPGKFYVLTMKVTTPAAADCNGASVQWTADVRTGNSFSGDPFAPNDITATTTALSVSCALSFTTPPSDALKDAAISPAIVVTGSPAALFAGQVVTLAIADDSPTTGTMGGDPTQTADSSGVATFGDISFAQSGDYKLVATSGGSTTGSSDTFTISDGTLGCDSTNNTATTFGVSVLRLPNVNDTDCVLIPYILQRDGNQIQFLKDPSIDPDAQFVVTVDSWNEENAVNPLPATQVDTPSPLHAIEWCLAPTPDPSILPGSEVTCLLDQSAAVQDSGKVKVNETYYLFGDILYKR
jgi:hypothetical protein